MKFIKLKRGDRQKITENFNTSEWFTNHKLNPDTQEVSKSLIETLQVFRDYFGVPIRIASAYRSRPYQKFIAKHNIFAAANSPHSYKIAVDFKFLKDNTANVQKFHEEVENKGKLWHILRKLGIGGFGLYDNFIHIDERPKNGFGNTSFTDKYGRYRIWDKRQKKK